jgi:hypothetical protein
VQNLIDDRTLQPWISDDDGTGRAVTQQRLRASARQFIVSSSFGF